jgi:hypothetical protein
MKELSGKEFEARLRAIVNKSYITKRDMLIPQAMKRADQVCGKESAFAPGRLRDEYNAKWNRVYHQTMNRLAKEAGL